MNCNILIVKNGIPELIVKDNKVLEFPSRIEAEQYIRDNNLLFAVATDVAGLQVGNVVGTVVASFINKWCKT